MSDALDLEKLEWEWEREGPQRTTSRTSFPLLVAEVRRLRALLTAEPDDEEVEAAWENFWTAYPCTVADMRRAVDAAIIVRARKMRGDTDE